MMEASVVKEAGPVADIERRDTVVRRDAIVARRDEDAMAMAMAMMVMEASPVTGLRPT
jgi:hypothetical protein